ncbi:hypothetical protein V3589_15095 [Sinorhizobium fredii]|uniref:hypothetical protein n=1 Tax=Rhizobium fredii TaxID=380 RepID=UPI0030AE3650
MKYLAVVTCVASVITAAVALHFYWQDHASNAQQASAEERRTHEETCREDTEMWGKESVQAQFSCGLVREKILKQMGIDTSGMNLLQINEKAKELGVE